MKTKIIKGKNLSEELQKIVFECLRRFSSNDIYLFTYSPKGLSIQDITEELKDFDEKQKQNTNGDWEK